MRHINIYLLLFTTILLSFSSCKAQKKATNSQQKQEIKRSFTPPEIPTMITNQQEQIDFMVKNFWNNFDFSDTTLINKPDFTEQIFVDYIYKCLNNSSSQEIANQGITKMIDKSMSGDSLMFEYFVSLSEKYLYDPLSTVRNDEMFIPVLEYIVSSPKVGEIDKIRYQFILEISKKNRIGEVANDFVYTMESGKTGRLSDIKSDYVMLFINNPECSTCKEVKKFISGSPIFNNFIYNPKPGKPTVKILSVYPDKDLTAWKNETYPDKWINGYDATLQIKDENLYNLQAIPTLYLLDKDKRVILKDAPVEVIEQWLSQNALK